jgi:acetyltransferase-like isoleucine patch superfamily enzyme
MIFKSLINLIQKLRTIILSERLTPRIFNFKYRVYSCLGYLRGLCAKFTGKVRISGASRALIVGPNVDWFLHAGACVELKDSEGSVSEPHNPLIADASQIGVNSFWKFLNPPVKKPTRLRIQARAKLVMEPNTHISPGTYISIWPDQSLTLKKDVYIGHECYINTRLGLTIGENTMIGHQSSIWDYDGHPIVTQGKDKPEDSYGGKASKVTIGKNVWIGFGVTILKGVNVGDSSIVAAKSFVVTDVPPNCIVAGNPAQVVKGNIKWEKF